MNKIKCEQWRRTRAHCESNVEQRFEVTETVSHVAICKKKTLNRSSLSLVLLVRVLHSDKLYFHLKQRFSTFLTLQLFNIAPHVVVTPKP